MKTVANQTGVIYAILRGKKVVYLGQTRNLRQRIGGHRCDWRKGKGNRRLVNIARKVQRQGGKLTFRVLEECLFGLDERERWWIAYGREKGWLLCNVEDGGLGGTWDDEYKGKASEKSREKWKDSQYQLRHAEAMRGAGEKIGAIRKGMTVEQYRGWRAEQAIAKERRRAMWQANMAKHAERAKAKEPLIFVPLTHKGTAFVPLTQGKWALIDVEDWDRVSEFQWYANQNGKWWRPRRANRDKMLLRHFLVGTGGDWPCDQLDCRRSKFDPGATSREAATAKTMGITLAQYKGLKAARHAAWRMRQCA